MSFEVIHHDTIGSVYVVYWPPTTSMIRFVKKTNLFEIMFKQVTSDNAGLAIKLNNGEYEIMWVNSDIWFDKRNYAEYVRDMYEIIGLAFKTKEEAELCADIMNKKLSWSILDGSHPVTI